MAEVLAMSAVEISRELLAQTVAHLRAASSTECVVLWLGRREANAVRVHEVFRPQQEAASDFFRIPRASMDALYEYIRPRRLMVAAQVHTHPEDAFHSAADDTWAIVRHVGALSLVVPRFCRDTTASNFTERALVFRLDERDQFREVGNSFYRVTT